MYIIFVSSQGLNMKLATRIQTELLTQQKEVKIVDLVSLNLPIYDAKTQKEKGIPSVITDYISEMTQCKGYVFVAPEYNYTTPATQNSFISWLSVVGDDFREVFNEKTILIATHSGGGGTDVLNSMRNQFCKLGAVVIPRQILTSYQTQLDDSSLTKTINQFLKI